MITAVRQLYGSVTSDTDNAANLTIVRKGVITAVMASFFINANTDGDNVKGELSFFPSFQGTTNDPNGPIMTVRAQCNFLTSGCFPGAINQALNGIAIPVEPGMKLFLNMEITGTLTFVGGFQVYITT